MQVVQGMANHLRGDHRDDQDPCYEDLHKRVAAEHVAALKRLRHCLLNRTLKTTGAARGRQSFRVPFSGSSLVFGRVHLRKVGPKSLTWVFFGGFRMVHSSSEERWPPTCDDQLEYVGTHSLPAPVWRYPPNGSSSQVMLVDHVCSVGSCSNPLCTIQDREKPAHYYGPFKGLDWISVAW